MKNPAEFFKNYDDYCFFQNPKNGFGLMSKDEYAEYEYYESCHEAEMDAENAWLRHAESATIDDMGFERWEHERMYA